MELFGIPNLGNTCYMASALQFLLSSKELINKLKNQDIRDIETNKDNFDPLYFSNFSKNRRHTVLYFKDKFEKYEKDTESEKDIKSQKDPFDFLSKIIRDNSKAFDPIHVKRVFLPFENFPEYEISKDGSHSEEFENFMTIDMRESEKFTGFLVNNYVQVMDYGIRIRVNLKLPNQIMINLKRFEIGKYGENKKITREYKMHEYIYFIENGKQVPYKLISFIFHSGSIENGHYTCYRKIKSQWFLCNDSSISEETVIPLNRGYLYLYEKVFLDYELNYIGNREIREDIDRIDNMDNRENREEFMNQLIINQDSESDIIFSQLFNREDVTLEEFYAEKLDDTNWKKLTTLPEK